MTRSQPLALALESVDPADLLKTHFGRSFRRSVSKPEERDAFQLRRIGSLWKYPVAVCEASPGRDLPDYAERRAWRKSLESPLSTGILIHTDASHSSFVWSWYETTVAGLRAYREQRRPRSDAGLIASLRLLTPAGPPGGPTFRKESQLEISLLEAFARGLPASFNRLRTGQDCQDMIEEVVTPAGLRILWRRLSRFTVIVEGGVSGIETLRVSARWLEGIYLACLDRMAAFVGDAESARIRRRPEFLSDLRSIVEPVNSGGTADSRETRVRRLIFQRNLFAVQEREADLARLAGDLRRDFPMIDVRLRLLDLNICRRRDFASDRPASSSRRVRVMADAEKATSGDLLESLEILRFAWAELRSLRLRDESSSEIVTANAQLGARRARLLADSKRSARVKPGGRKEPIGAEKDSPGISFAAPPRRFAFDLRFSA